MAFYNFVKNFSLKIKYPPPAPKIQLYILEMIWKWKY